MSRNRLIRRVPQALAALLVCGHLASVVLTTEMLWPFHPILVYTRPPLDLGDSEPLLVAFGNEDAGGSPGEVDVVALGWVDQRTQRILAQGVAAAPVGPPRERLLVAIAARFAAEQCGPPGSSGCRFAGIRVYRLQWDLRTGAVQSRELLGESRIP